MAQEISRKRIEKFKQKVDFLISKGISQETIAEKMGMASSNFSAYLNENNPITGPFLAKFNAAWGAEFESEADKGLTKDVSEIYRIHDIIVEKLVDGQNMLIKSNIAIVEYNQKLMDLLTKAENGGAGSEKSK